MSRLAISFSGGRTSAYMTQRLLRLAQPGDEILVIFANTGEEDEETLKFVNRCDLHYKFKTIWLEADVQTNSGSGTQAIVVDFVTANRRGAPFEAVIAKYGIPNSSFPHCTRELKQAPMRAFLRSIGWDPGTYNLAIGIRADEADRMSADAAKWGIYYPLIKWGVKKDDVIAWWREQPFDLYIPEYLGNCKSCWKKTDRKLLTLARERPEVFDFNRRMEATYAHAGAGQGPRRFFRRQRLADDFISAATQPFEPWVDGNQVFDPELDAPGGCGESCEVGADFDWDAER